MITNESTNNNSHNIETKVNQAGKEEVTAEMVNKELTSISPVDNSSEGLQTESSNGRKEIENNINAEQPNVVNRNKAIDSNAEYFLRLKNERILKEMNKEFAVINFGRRVMIVWEKKDDPYKKNQMDLIDISCFNVKMSNKKVTVVEDGKFKVITRAKFWLSHPGRREYKGITFNPGKIECPEYYNLYRGFSVKPKGATR